MNSRKPNGTRKELDYIFQPNYTRLGGLSEGENCGLYFSVTAVEMICLVRETVKISINCMFIHILQQCYTVAVNSVLTESPNYQLSDAEETVLVLTSVFTE